MFVQCGAVLLLASSAVAISLCTPEQWKGHLSTSTAYGGYGIYGIADEQKYVYYDAKNTRSLQEVVLRSSGFQQEFKKLAIFDGDKGKLYTIHKKTGLCHIEDIPRPFDAICLGEFDQKAQDYVLGAEKGGLEVSQYVNDNPLNVITNDVIIGDDYYVPVLHQTVGVVEGYDTTSVTKYESIVAGEIDPSVFEIPASCKKSAGIPKWLMEVREKRVEHFTIV